MMIEKMNTSALSVEKKLLTNEHPSHDPYMSVFEKKTAPIPAVELIYEFSDGTHVEITRLKSGNFQAAWLDPNKPDEALDYSPETVKTCRDAIKWTRNLARKAHLIINEIH